MANLAGQSRVPLQQPTAQHDAEADARANIEHREVVESPRQAVVAFRQAEGVRFLKQHARQPQPRCQVAAGAWPLVIGTFGDSTPRPCR